MESGKATTTTFRTAVQSSAIDPAILSKYGYQAVAASAGAFATSFAVGTVQKHIITNITRPLIFGSKETEEAGASASGTETDVSSLVKPSSLPNLTEETNPVMNEYLAKYGNPKDPNATVPNIVQPIDETEGFAPNHDTEIDYSAETEVLHGHEDVGAEVGDFGAVNDTFTEVNSEEGGLIDLIGGIFNLLGGGDGA